MNAVIDQLTERKSVPLWVIITLATLAGGWASLVAILVALAGNSSLPAILG